MYKGPDFSHPCQHLLIFKGRFYLVMAVLGLLHYARASSGYRASGATLAAVHGLLMGLVSLNAQAQEHRLNSAVLRLRCPEERGIFPDQGLNPCPLHWLQILYHRYQEAQHLLFIF